MNTVDHGFDGSTAADLQHQLFTPTDSIALESLPLRWRHVCITGRCRGEAVRVERHDLVGKLRGALGEALMATASREALAGEPCTWSPRCGLDILFRCQGKVTKALDLPKPYVIGLDVVGEDLLAHLTLFGMAEAWRDSIADAWIHALRSPLGIGSSFDVIDRVVAARTGVACLAASKLQLAFKTPVQIRQGQERKELTLPLLVSSLGNRISGLARWQGLQVDADWPALKAHAETLRVTKQNAETHHWQRYSRRQDRRVPLAGSRESWVIQGDLAPLMPLISIGSTTHVGSRTTFGLGRFGFEVLPDTVGEQIGCGQNASAGLSGR